MARITRMMRRRNVRVTIMKSQLLESVCPLPFDPSSFSTTDISYFCTPITRIVVSWSAHSHSKQIFMLFAIQHFRGLYHLNQLYFMPLVSMWPKKSTSLPQHRTTLLVRNVNKFIWSKISNTVTGFVTRETITNSHRL